jgi:O-antigen biosynthesis protein
MTMRTPATRKIATVLTALSAIVVAILALAGQARADGNVEIRGKQLVVDGRSLLVKGVHYGPWRPGTGPGKSYSYPSRHDVDEDLRMIQSLNANTILVFDAPAYVLDLAQRHGLKVIYVFHLDWWTIGTPDGAGAVDSIKRRVTQLRDKPALLAWVLGNEVGSVQLEQRGPEPIEDGLHAVYRDVKSLDPDHPITHSSWPPAKDLDLSFLDFVSFNLYPIWPPEVVAMGYQPYIERVLQPIAGNRPLLISEFGVNTIESGEDGQARLLTQSWSAIRDADTAGGVVFEFADEWWKNYDNPKRSGNWWDRRTASDDEATHDLDPEENYGIVDAQRRPKPAFTAVREMFKADGDGKSNAILAVPVTLLALMAGGLWVWGKTPRPRSTPTRMRR